MRIINTFADLDLLERFHPVCMNCERKGVPLYEFKADDSVMDYKRRLVCFKCHSKNVKLILMSNYYIHGTDLRRQAWFSNDLRGPIEVGKVKALPFRGAVN